MNRWRWVAGLIFILVLLGVNFLCLTIPLVYRLINILLFCVLLLLFRVARGPSAADRIVAVDILGILITGVCGLLALATGRSFFLDIAIAWALQSFIATLALAKVLEGRRLND